MTVVTVFSLLAGLADLAGGWLTLAVGIRRDRIDQLLALGTGLFLGGAFFTLMPAAMGETAAGTPMTGAIYVAVGFLGLFVVRQAGTSCQSLTDGPVPVPVSAWTAFTGLLLHSFYDGAALGAAVQAGPQLGLMALLAIFLHKLPEGFSLAAIVIGAGGSGQMALLATSAVGMATVLGGWSVWLWASAGAVPHGALIGLAAGSFLYIGSVEMLPPLLGRRETTPLILTGAALVWLLSGLYGGTFHHH